MNSRSKLITQAKKLVYYLIEAQKSAVAEIKAHLQFRKLGTGLQGRIHLVKPSA